MAILCILQRPKEGPENPRLLSGIFEGGTDRGVSARERMPRRTSRLGRSKHAFGTKRLIVGHRMPIDAAGNVVGKLGFGSGAVNVFGCGEGLRCYGSELYGWLSLTGLGYLPV
ncbi:hypothetical protein HO173_005582 [Letharia columbiana]|uniref:Uncharacterized protein n=1 Tax=Letharia columbiana TaxID=112416 RepID=A0A8H6L533_9LECA|nr:uncharacterized protein HO173_005582 [Letharia columbiana]KAF6235954.1 hypothetical protein HO173_005582 [Letharia columbiana]